MKLESSISIEAPPHVVFRFYAQLDHLRFVSPVRRREWCPRFGVALEEGAEYEVRIEQGKHGLHLRFRTTRFVPHSSLENEFLSWPLKGARHEQRFEARGGGTLVSDVNFWVPPWYARGVVAQREDEQRRFFAEKLEKAKRLIEAVYARAGEAAFRDGIFEDAADVGIAPVIGPEP